MEPQPGPSHGASLSRLWGSHQWGQSGAPCSPCPCPGGVGCHSQDPGPAAPLSACSPSPCPPPGPLCGPALAAGGAVPGRAAALTQTSPRSAPSPTKPVWTPGHSCRNELPAGAWSRAGRAGRRDVNKPLYPLRVSVWLFPGAGVGFGKPGGSAGLGAGGQPGTSWESSLGEYQERPSPRFPDPG